MSRFLGVGSCWVFAYRIIGRSNRLQGIGLQNGGFRSDFVEAVELVDHLRLYASTSPRKQHSLEQILAWVGKVIEHTLARGRCSDSFFLRRMRGLMAATVKH